MMLHVYRKLSIPTKLALAACCLLIPLGILTFFINISFQHDINIGRSELGGTKALRDAFHIHHYLANSWTLSKIKKIPPAKTQALEIETASPPTEIQHALGRLTATLADTKLNQTAKMNTCVSLSRVHSSWAWYNSTGEIAAYRDTSEAFLELITQISNCAQLALDPALDSQMLSHATVNMLPQSSAVMSDLQTMALVLIQETPSNTAPQLSLSQRDALVGSSSYFRDGIFKRVIEDSNIAMMEDANYYTSSPTLALQYGSRLEHYQKSANLLLEVVSRMKDGQASPIELFNAASRVRSAGFKLFSSAMDEMDILIQKRIDGYQHWQLFGVGSSAAGLFIAILVLMATSRNISQGIKAVMNYTRRVAAGDYNAHPDDTDLGPRLRAMVNDTDAMVTILKDKISFLDGVLQGITVPCFMVDRDERVTFVNKPALALAGRSEPIEKILGQQLALLIYGDADRPTITGQCMAENRPIKDKLLDINSADGTMRHIRFDVAPITGPDGESTGAIAVVTDLTDLIEKEKNIERLAAFPREAPDPVLSTGPDGAILYLNTAASSILEASGLALDQNFLPEGHTEIVASCLSTGAGRYGIESQVGTQSYSWTYHPLPDQKMVHMYATDITKRIRAENQLLHDAFHDTLTGLPNKALFLDRVNQAFRRARSQNTQFAILFFDLDGFKNINDGLGHNVGDKLLARVAWRIQKLLNPDETVARLGGDEFTVLLPRIKDDRHALQVAKTIQKNLRTPFDLDGLEMSVSASIGVINAPDGASDASELLRDAETAMYKAKSMGRARAEMFSPAMHKDASERIQLENDLKKAVEQGEFEPYYQPIISLETGTIIGFEALIRWIHPTQGIISPGRFISMAEETGLIIPMGAFMLERACKQAKKWQEQHIAHRDLTISVNMSVVQMTRPTIGEEIKTLLKQTGLPPQTLKIEITESGLMNNIGHASELLKGLEKIGVSLIIDDFGTGYSSLSHLHQFPFHCLKIDQTFVSTMEDKPDNMEIVRSIISLAHTLGKQVVAEGVETESQKEQLVKLGCEYVQGYYFARPLSAAKAEDLLDKNPQW